MLEGIDGVRSIPFNYGNCCLRELMGWNDALVLGKLVFEGIDGVERCPCAEKIGV